MFPDSPSNIKKAYSHQTLQEEHSPAMAFFSVLKQEQILTN
jgi:hypothetical protein